VFQEALTYYLLLAMSAWIPTARHTYEKPAATEARYADLAEDIAFVTLESDPLFEGDGAVEKTGLLLASIASFESEYDGRTGSGLSVIPGDNDHGRAVGYFQTHVYEPWAGGLTRAQLALSPRDQARVALRMMRTSFFVCRGQGVDNALAWYAEGGNTCGKTDGGRAKSRHRVQRALAWYKEHGEATEGYEDYEDLGEDFHEAR
jgi:hypothetical protein